MSGRQKLVTTLFAVILTVSFALGFHGLTFWGEYAEVPSLLRPGIPVMLDLGLVVFSFSATLRRAEGKPAKYSWTWMGVLTATSMALQVAHVIMVRGIDTGSLIGAALSALFPLVILASSHPALDMAVGPLAPRARRRATSVKVAAVAAPIAYTPAVVSPAAPKAFVPAPLAVAATPRATRRSSAVPDPRLELALKMHDVEGKSYADIAIELNWHLSAVKRAFAAHKLTLVVDEPEDALAA